MMSSNQKRILFLTGTRADFGKLKPLMDIVRSTPEFEYQIFATGMHLLSKYGNTAKEIYRSGFDNVFTYMNQIEGEDMEVVLANTIKGMSRFLHENHVDLLVVHGDRVEALSGATVGALRNVLVAHVEGGEVSGTVDELMRHAISKMSHLHFVASETARKRLVQMGEYPDSIFLIGSPDVDVMLSPGLPSLEQVKRRYEIEFDRYSVAILHPVTTELANQAEHARVFVESLVESHEQYIVIYPNNDLGSQCIFDEYTKISEHERFRLFPSLRFEYFLTLLKNAELIIGNSSAGIHEAPIYGVPTVNIGERQHRRMSYPGIHNVPFGKSEILNAVARLKGGKRYEPSRQHGDGKSAENFLAVLREGVWETSKQKYFRDLGFDHG